VNGPSDRIRNETLSAEPTPEPIPTPDRNLKPQRDATRGCGVTVTLGTRAGLLRLPGQGRGERLSCRLEDGREIRGKWHLEQPLHEVLEPPGRVVSVVPVRRCRSSCWFQCSIPSR
jgi:hypothetical protein